MVDVFVMPLQAACMDEARWCLATPPIALRCEANASKKVEA